MHSTQVQKEQERKRMCRQFPCSLDGMLVDREQTYQWLKFGDIKGVWVVECSRHSRTNTTVFCCRYTDTRRQLLALKRAAGYQPVMQT
jgi:hypothetical protein